MRFAEHAKIKKVLKKALDGVLYVDRQVSVYMDPSGFGWNVASGKYVQEIHFAYDSAFEDTFYIPEFYMLESARSRGMGSIIMEKIAAAMKAEGFTTLGLVNNINEKWWDRVAKKYGLELVDLA